MGFCFNPPTLLLGPIYNYQTYLDSFTQKEKAIKELKITREQYKRSQLKTAAGKFIGGAACVIFYSVMSPRFSFKFLASKDFYSTNSWYTL